MASEIDKNGLVFIPKAYPGYDSKMHSVKKWLVEFVEEEGELIPWREIALDRTTQMQISGKYW